MIIQITKDEILNTPNDMELGALVRNRMWQEDRNLRGPQFDDEHFGLKIDENGLVTDIIRPQNIFEVCIMCGETTNVLVDTHIDFRIGYIEGAGQLCKKCWEKNGK